MSFFFSSESQQGMGRPMLSLKYQPGHLVSFLRMDKGFISWSYDSKNMLQCRVGEGMVKVSNKQFNMYFSLSTSIVHIPMSEKWHTFLVGLQFIVRFTYLDDLSRNKRMDCDDLPVAFGIWKNSWLSGSSRWLLDGWNSSLMVISSVLGCEVMEFLHFQEWLIHHWLPVYHIAVWDVQN